MNKRRFLAMLLKEVIQLTRDSRIFILIFMAPFIQLVIFGYAVNLDVKFLKTGVLNLDQSNYSRELINLIDKSDNFNLVYSFENREQIEQAFDKNLIKIGLIIPSNFSEKIELGDNPRAQVYFDGTDANTCRIALGYFASLENDFLNNVLKEKTMMTTAAQDYNRIRIKFNPHLKSVNFMLSGIIGSILMVMTLVLSSANLVREKEYGTFEQLITTPVKGIEIISAKILPFFVLGYIDVVLVVLISVHLFGVPFRGGLPLLLLVSFPFLLSTLGIGMFVSSISENQRQAMFTSVIFMIPNILLSGFFFPIENMPKVIQAITYLIPLRYFLVILRGIFLKGTNLYDFYTEAILLTLFGVLIFFASVSFFSKRHK